jgi:hypothetical protein
VQPFGQNLLLQGFVVPFDLLAVFAKVRTRTYSLDCRQVLEKQGGNVKKEKGGGSKSDSDIQEWD